MNGKITIPKIPLVYTIDCAKARFSVNNSGNKRPYVSLIVPTPQPKYCKCLRF